jgi:hypothetical protein
VHARHGMNVIVRRDVGPYHVLGGGSGNETTYYEFEKGVQVDPGYHVYQVTVFSMIAVVRYTESITYVFSFAMACVICFVFQVWLVDSRWRTVSFDDVVFELLP